MKRLHFILTALLLLVAVPAVRAAWVVTESVVPASAVKTGQYYVIEAASCSDVLEHYLKAGTTKLPSLVDSLCVWELVEVPSKNPYTKETQYYFKNFKTGEYLYRNAGTYESADDATPWLIHAVTDSIEYNGTWLNFASVANKDQTKYPKGWDENSSTISQTIYSDEDKAVGVYFLANYWSTGGAVFWSYHDTNAWNFHEVTNDGNVRNDLQAVVDEYDANDYDSYFPASDTQPYATYTAVVSAMKEAYAAAVEVLADENAGDAAIIAAQIALQNAIAACKSSDNTVPLSDGYYYIISSYSGFTAKGDEGRMSWFYSEANLPNMHWKLIDTADKLPFLWHVTVNSDGTIKMQNMYSGMYVNGASSDAKSQNFTLVSDNPQKLAIKTLGMGQFSIYTDGHTNSYRFGHPRSHSNGSGTTGRVTTWTSALNAEAAWHFEAETDQALIDSANNALSQRILDNKLASLISSGESKIAAASVEGVLGTGAVVTDPTQFSSNNPEVNGEGMTEEQMYENLLDGNTATFYHSAWMASSDVEDAYHYLQVKANGELPSSVQMYWYRRMTNNNNRPTNVGISVSADGTNWTVLIDSLQEGLPTGSSADSSYYISPSISIPAGNKYFRLTVYKTNIDKTSKQYFHPYFTFSEFNLYEQATWGIDPSKSQSARAEVAAQIAVLQAALDKAGEVAEGTATQADIDALQTAIDAFNAVWADTTEFVSAVEKAEALLLNAVPGDEIGQFPASSISSLEFLLAAVKMKRPLYSETKATIDSYTETITDELNKYMASMVVPSENKWYYIVSNVSTTVRAEDGDDPKPTREQVIYTGDYSAGSSVLWGGNPAENADNARAAWKFIKQADGTYAIQNMATGWYMGQASKSGSIIYTADSIVRYNFAPLTGNAAGDDENAGGQVGLESADYGLLLNAQWSGKRIVSQNEDPAGNSACSWTFEEVPTDAQREVKVYKQNRYYVVTVPYATIDVPNATDGTDLSFYTLTGATRNALGTITELLFSTYEGTTLTPGTPYLMKVGAKTDDVENDTVLVDMQIDAEATDLYTEASKENGLQGVLTNVSIQRLGYGYFSSEENVLVTDGEERVTIWAQRGYIIADEVENLAGASNDLVIAVEGEGLVNKINGATVTENEIVSVYTVDGVLVRKNVPAATAAQGLQKGVYIIGSKKAVVK